MWGGYGRIYIIQHITTRCLIRSKIQDIVARTLDNTDVAIVPSFWRLKIYNVLYVFPTGVFVCIAFLVFMDFEVEKHVCHFWTETVKILDALLSLLPPYGSKGHL